MLQTSSLHCRFFYTKRFAFANNHSFGMAVAQIDLTDGPAGSIRSSRPTIVRARRRPRALQQQTWRKDRPAKSMVRE